MISTTSELAELCEKIRLVGSVALDTEFVWTRTFWPNLGLVQAGWGEGEAVLIDAPSLDDFSPLATVLEDPDVTLILHDAPQDLTILRRACGGVPVNVFDTRLAAGFCGLGGTLSLNALLNELLDIDLPKTETRTNWLHRPLTESQIEYALDDVRYLHRLQELLLERISGSNNNEAFNEERCVIENPALTNDRAPENMWSRIKSAKRMKDRERACLQELAAWREIEARRRDRPRNMVAAEKLLVDFARKQPQTVEEFEPWKKEHKATLSRYGKELLAAVKRGLEVTEIPPALGGGKKSAGIDKLTDAWMKLRDECAEASVIEPSFISTKAELSALAGLEALPAEGDHRIFQGWRGEVFGTKLRELSQA